MWELLVRVRVRVPVRVRVRVMVWVWEVGSSFTTSYYRCLKVD
jgi:hypothetical protein